MAHAGCWRAGSPGRGSRNGAGFRRARILQVVLAGETGAFAEGNHIRLRRLAGGTCCILSGDPIRAELSQETPPAITGRVTPSMVDETWCTPTELSTAEFQLGSRRLRGEPPDDIDAPTAEQRATMRRAARTRFRAYCIACGRSSESATAPPRLSRCYHCSGTMLVEPVTNWN